MFVYLHQMYHSLFWLKSIPMMYDFLDYFPLLFRGKHIFDSINLYEWHDSYSSVVLTGMCAACCLTVRLLRDK